MEGKPLPEGEIIFEEADQTITPAATKIAQGRYVIRVLPGSKKVRITASRPTKIPDPVMGAAAREALLGPEYNKETRFTCEVGNQTLSGVDFEVTPLP